MKNTNEIITAIETTFEKLGDDLSRKQSTILAGCLLVWFEQIRMDEREKTLDKILMLTIKSRNKSIKNGPTTTAPTKVPIDDIFGIINFMRSYP